jgi:hypothetical protein
VTVLAALLAAIAGLFAATSRDGGTSAAVAELTPSPQPAADPKPIAVPLRHPARDAQWCGPGARVDILATARIRDKSIMFPLLVRVLVVRVDKVVSDVPGGPQGPAECDIVFAVNQQQAQLIELAKSRGCRLRYIIRGIDRTGDDRHYDIDDVLKFLTELEPDTIPPPRLKSVE